MNNQIIKYLFLVLILLQGITVCKKLSQKEEELKDNIYRTVNLQLSQTVQQANTLLSLEELKQNHGISPWFTSKQLQAYKSYKQNSYSGYFK